MMCYRMARHSSPNLKPGKKIIICRYFRPELPIVIFGVSYDPPIKPLLLIHETVRTTLSMPLTIKSSLVVDTGNHSKSNPAFHRYQMAIKRCCWNLLWLIALVWINFNDELREWYRVVLFYSYLIIMNIVSSKQKTMIHFAWQRTCLLQREYSSLVNMCFKTIIYRSSYKREYLCNDIASIVLLFD